MQTLMRILAVLFLAAFFGVAAAVQTESDDRYRIALTIDGVSVQGSQERTTRLIGKTREEQDGILAEPLPTLRRGQSFQLVVSVADPSGKKAIYTQSKYLDYESFGCLTISKQGFVTAVPSGVCHGEDLPALWIILNDSKGNPVAVNEYLFRVLPRVDFQSERGPGPKHITAHSP